MNDDNNVHALDESQDKRTGNSTGEEQRVPTAAMAATSRDMSKVAVIVSLLVVVLLVIFFFGMNRNIAGLTEEVKSLGALRQDVSDLNKRVVQVEEEMPLQMKLLIAQSIVNEMAMKAAYLGNTLEDDTLREKMQEILQSLKDVRQNLEQ